MFRALLAVFLTFFTTFASARSTITTQHSLNACGAGTDHSSAGASDACVPGVKFDVGLTTYGSFQIVWSGLTGTVNGVVKLQASNDGVTWTDKSSATVTLSGASGNGMISMNGTMSEQYYQVVYTHTGITGGTLDVYSVGK